MLQKFYQNLVGKAIARSVIPNTQSGQQVAVTTSSSNQLMWTLYASGHLYQFLLRYSFFCLPSTFLICFNQSLQLPCLSEFQTHDPDFWDLNGLTFCLPSALSALSCHPHMACYAPYHRWWWWWWFLPSTVLFPNSVSLAFELKRCHVGVSTQARYLDKE